MIADSLRENPEFEIGVSNRFWLEEFLPWCLTREGVHCYWLYDLFAGYWDQL